MNTHFLDNPIQVLSKKVLMPNEEINVESSSFTVNLVDEDMVFSPSTTNYIKRYVRTNHGILFKMNDSSVQQIFVDGEELLLDSVNKRVVTIDKNG